MDEVGGPFSGPLRRFGRPAISEGPADAADETIFGDR